MEGTSADLWPSIPLRCTRASRKRHTPVKWGVHRSIRIVRGLPTPPYHRCCCAPARDVVDV